MERIVREGAFTFGKDDFLRALLEIKKLAFKKSTIRSGFRATGIVPFNPNHVLETMGQWVYEHKLTVEQELAQWQEVFMPLAPYQTITLPAKTQREIDRDLAFNAREIRQRDIRKAMQEKEVVQSASQIIIGQLRPSREVLLRFFTLRSFHRGVSYRGVDENAFTAATALLLAHIDGHLLGQINVLEHQRPRDLGIISEVLDLVQEISTASSMVQNLKELVEIESEVADGANYAWTDESGVGLELKIPYFGTIRAVLVSPQREASRQDESLLLQSSSLDDMT
jgi:hypothetical protein